MKKIAVIFFSCIALSCQKKRDIQLPEIDCPSPALTVRNPGDPVYLFYDPSEPDSLYPNLKKALPASSRTVYTDKCLRLKHVIPQLKKLREQQLKQVEADRTKMYVPVMEDKGKEVFFLDISDIAYKTNDQFSKFYIKDLPEQHMNLLTLTINFKRNDDITVDGNPIERAELLSFLKEYIDFVSEGKNTLIYLNFDENLTFQKYISGYCLMMQLRAPAIQIAGIEFIYNEALLPDCHCEL